MLRLLLPARLLRIEAAAALLLLLLLYRQHGGSWLLFIALIIAPDLAALGYLAGPRIGASCYNLAHAVALPALLAVYGVVGDHAWAVSVALIWAAHIAADRLLGYGLKYPTAFQDSHVSRV